MVWIVFSHMWKDMMFCYFHCSPVAAIFSWKLRYRNIQRVRLHNVIMGKLFISLFLIFCALMLICIKSVPLSVCKVSIAEKWLYFLSEDYLFLFFGFFFLNNKTSLKCWIEFKWSCLKINCNDSLSIPFEHGPYRLLSHSLKPD